MQFYNLIVAVILAILITALFYLQFRNKKLSQAIELKAMQQQKELYLLQAIIKGEENVRSRIAYELHDGITSRLAAIKLHLSSINHYDDLSGKENFQQGMRLLDEASQEIRKTSNALMPLALIQSGLDEALRRFCNSICYSKTIKIQYDSWGEIDRFNHQFELSVFHIFQELIDYLIRHFKPGEILVQLTQQKKLLSFSLECADVHFINYMYEENRVLRNLQTCIKAINGKSEIHLSEKEGIFAYIEFDVSELKKGIDLVYE